MYPVTVSRPQRLPITSDSRDCTWAWSHSRRGKNTAPLDAASDGGTYLASRILAAWEAMDADVHFAAVTAQGGSLDGSEWALRAQSPSSARRGREAVSC